MSNLLNILSNSGFMLNTVTDIGNAINTFVFGLLYTLVQGIWWILDVVQLVFRKVAGLDTIYDKASNEKGSDIIVMLFQSDLAKNILFSIMGVGIVLLFVFSVIAIIRNIYKEEKNVTVGSIIGNAMKGLLGYLFVPFICMFGILFSNVILQGVDSATSQPGASTFSSRIFIASAYNANIFREESAVLGKWNFESALKYAKIINNNFGDKLGFKVTNLETPEDLANFADVIDYNFAANFPNATDPMNATTGNVASYMSWSDKNGDVWYILDTVASDDAAGFSLFKTEGVAPYHNMIKVSSLYNLWKFNYIYAIFGTIFVAYALLSIIFGLIKRIYKLLIYYLISPFMLAMYPIDNGEAFKSWRKEFVGYVVGAYAAIGILNLFIFTLPLFDQIYLFTGGNLNIFNGLVQLLLFIVGALTVKELTTTVTGWIGGKDIASEGKAVMGEVGKATAKVGKGVLSAAGFGFGAISNQALRNKEATKAGDDAVAKLGPDADAGTVELAREQAKKAARDSSKYKSIGQSLGGLAGSVLGKSEGVKAFNEGSKIPRADFPLAELNKEQFDTEKRVEEGLSKLTEKEFTGKLDPVTGKPEEISKTQDDFIKANKQNLQYKNESFLREQRHIDTEKSTQKTLTSSLSSIIGNSKKLSDLDKTKFTTMLAAENFDGLTDAIETSKMSITEKNRAFSDIENLRKSITSEQDAEQAQREIEKEIFDIQTAQYNMKSFVETMEKQIRKEMKEHGAQNVNYEKIAKKLVKGYEYELNGKNVKLSDEMQKQIIDLLTSKFPSKK